MTTRKHRKRLFLLMMLPFLQHMKPRDNTRQRNNITTALNSLMLLQTDAPTKYWNISYCTSRCLEHASKFTLHLTEELYNLSPAWGRVMIWKESSQLEIIKQAGKENNQHAKKRTPALIYFFFFFIFIIIFNSPNIIIKIKPITISDN